MSDGTAHFDVNAILTHVSEQDVGLRVSTNNPEGFRRILYAAMRASPALRCYVYADPRSAASFFLLKAPAPAATPLEDTSDA